MTVDVDDDNATTPDPGSNLVDLTELAVESQSGGVPISTTVTIIFGAVVVAVATVYLVYRRKRSHQSDDLVTDSRTGTGLLEPSPGRAKKHLRATTKQRGLREVPTNERADFGESTAVFETTIASGVPSGEGTVYKEVNETSFHDASRIESETLQKINYDESELQNEPPATHESQVIITESTQLGETSDLSPSLMDDGVKYADMSNASLTNILGNLNPSLSKNEILTNLNNDETRTADLTNLQSTEDMDKSKISVEDSTLAYLTNAEASNSDLANVENTGGLGQSKVSVGVENAVSEHLTDIEASNADLTTVENTGGLGQSQISVGVENSVSEHLTTDEASNADLTTVENTGGLGQSKISVGVENSVSEHLTTDEDNSANISGSKMPETDVNAESNNDNVVASEVENAYEESNETVDQAEEDSS